eukprot:1159840-Pelagomonas_calceolata.AAC.7
MLACLQLPFCSQLAAECGQGYLHHLPFCSQLAAECGQGYLHHVGMPAAALLFPAFCCAEPPVTGSFGSLHQASIHVATLPFPACC